MEKRIRAGSLWRLWRQLSLKRRHQLVIVVVCMIAGAVAEVVSLGAIVPFLTAMANPDLVLGNSVAQWLLVPLGIESQFSLLIFLTTVFCVAAILSAGFRILLTWATNRYAFMIGHDLGMKLFERVLRQPYSWHVNRNTSETIADIQKVQTVTSGMIVPLMQAFSSLFISLFIVTALVLVEPAVTIGAFAGFGLIYFLTSLRSQTTLRDTGGVIAQTANQRVQVIQESIGGIRDVLLDGSQEHFLTRLRRLDRRLRDAQAVANLIGATPRFVVEGLGMVLIACFALFLSTRQGGFLAALPVLGAIALGAQRLLPMLQIAYSGWVRVVANTPILEDVLVVLELPEPSERATPLQPLPFNEAIVLKNVSFSYGEGLAPVLNDINIEIRKGTKLGVFGKTGSGKSSMVDIIMGLLEPTSGTIEVDGRPLDSAGRQAWRAQIAHVPQAIFLADASIAENIAFGVDKKHIDMEQVRQVAERAELSEVVAAMPEGYDSQVGERGVRLSGGQRQRLGIARALYKRAEVLVFDEATSALDNQTEASVMHAIDGLSRDLTVIVIAHRLTTLRNCDRLLHLEAGRSSWADRSALELH